MTAAATHPFPRKTCKEAAAREQTEDKETALP